MQIVFVDANETLGGIATRLRDESWPLKINLQPDITPDQLPAVIGDAEAIIIDHTHLPLDIARACPKLKHVIFLGTGPRSYMDPDALKAELGIEVHIIKGYGDTAVAEFAISLMWTAAKGIALMDRGMREGQWLRTDGMQLTGKTLGLIGFGSIAAEVARIAGGSGMKVVAWNRSPKSHPGVDFLSLEEVLGQSDVLSVHLLLTDETRGFLSAERLAQMKPGSILVNTARGAIVDEAAMIARLKSGELRAAGLDVYNIEPMPAGHVLTTLPNAVLSAHSAFRTAEANDNLILMAFDHYKRVSGLATVPA